ncbi:Putative glycosyltransferase EpsF (plasmid) [Sulfitobacter indolifex]|uniref:Glycosyl transferase, group 1 family protein n=1 Tax=Sulfitobacter indolifex HEL-45 TaxID=391624 RepID=A0ABP2D3R9_9RHOB|nr:glycosyltransferase family 4 protein [Sulfitobacter indolifex]EDQ03006.1 glycosyl transferase, group 1 family protein [Sulfitobacter indolifex HEL-45]UOA21218.1 Putative glycosyltransferase EpsF [Sulfitobacter indolifex]
MADTLRVALILETSGGGSGRHLLDLARGLLARGHDVTVIWAPGRAQQDFVDALHAVEGLKTVTVEMARAVGPGDVKSLRALQKVLQCLMPFDILHGHSSKAGALIRLLPRSIPGARIYTPHAFRTMDPGLGQPHRLIYGIIERVLAARATRIIAVSQAEADHASAVLGIAANRLSLVVNGVSLSPDATREAARQAIGLSDQELAVGFIGRLEDQKDPLRFLRGIALAAKRVSHLKAIVIGDGPLRAEAEALAEGSNVHFMGWQDGPRLMPGLDIFCMTSRYEAMPYTLLEAIHGGVPIIMTAVGGANETVLEGVSGHVLPLDCGDQDLGEALVSLARDEARRKSFSSASRHLARSRTIDAMVDDTISIYIDAIAPVSVEAI